MFVIRQSWLFALLAVLLSTASPVFAATVTVNAAAEPVPGSIYPTVQAAAGSLVGGDAWGNGVADTILVTDDAVVVETGQTTFQAFEGGDGTVAIRNNPGDTPIIALGGDPPPVRLFKVDTTMKATFDGLTIIGAAGVIPISAVGAEIRTPFWFEADSEDDIVSVTVTNCVVTRNKGENVPELDYSATFDPAGTFQRFLFAGDDPYRGLISCTVQDCVFAFCPTTYSALQFDRRVQVEENPNEPATRTLTLRNTLITQVLGYNSDTGEPSPGGGHILRARDIGPETTYNFIDCCLADCDGRGFLFGLNDEPQIGMNINVTHCIFDTTGGSAPINIDGLWVGGALMVDGATFVRPGADMIDLEKMGDGEGSVTLRNIISTTPDDSVFRWRPENTETETATKPGTLVVSNINSDGDAYRPGQHDDIKAAFNADYGGAGTFHDNPMFVSTDIDASYAGIRKWDSTTNTLFDVNNPTFAGKGSGGSDLVGGAECPACGGTGVDDWNLY